MLKASESSLFAISEKTLFTEEQIRIRTEELGREISADYKGREVVCICRLKGAAFFFSDLVRCIDLPMRLDFMSISSYGTATASSGVVRILKDLDRDIVGQDVLVVEDIVDTGLTLSFLTQNLMARGAGTLKTCTLLDKPFRRKVPADPDYVGFQIEDHFVIGYGMDYKEYYRNLPEIGILKPEVYSD
jgi:hypoxanthine phosphoribosyltransferase